MLDCGLCGASLGLSLHQLRSVSEISMIGGMAEQLVGQLLRSISPAYVPLLFITGREKKRELKLIISSNMKTR
ncbi:hypothetical protein RHAB15C_0000419 [Candidatus Rhabdochlamydia porcellionis]|jgi:hypothetical protein|uniref:Uncharacterized protein n=1 Tax=Candidatus Rhabdochlamydia porcellionis TaxID=225148 RepID=A0ABX8YZL4_9BACT|nr:hypothetical protein RHAB15C_0000419 [Candidatus Rhabdochlamydia porcellionis]